jgi:hypothetical protein
MLGCDTVWLVNRCQSLLSEAGGCRFLRNVGIILIYETTWRHIPENGKSSWSQPWELKNSHDACSAHRGYFDSEMSHRLVLSSLIKNRSKKLRCIPNKGSTQSRHRLISLKFYLIESLVMTTKWLCQIASAAMKWSVISKRNKMLTSIDEETRVKCYCN